VATTSRSRVSRLTMLIGTVVGIMAVVVVALVVHSGSRPSSVASPSTALCSALKNINTYASTHPTVMKYPNLEQSLQYSNQQMMSVTTPPAVVASSVLSAQTSSASMVHTVQQIIAHVTMTKAQKMASLNQILVWRKSIAALGVWQKTHC